MIETQPDDKIKISLEDQVKAAERDKLIAETEKIKAERDKRWWLTAQFWRSLIKSIVGLTFLGFVITYILIPLHNHDIMQAKIDNLQLSMDNKIAANKLYEKEIKFKKDSIKFINEINSIKIDLDKKAKIIELQKSSRDSVEIGYQKVIKNYKEENDSKIQQATKELEKLKTAYEDQSIAYYESIKNKTSFEPPLPTTWVRFNFKDMKGKSLKLKNATITIGTVLKPISSDKIISSDHFEIKLTAPDQYFVKVFSNEYISEDRIYMVSENTEKIEQYQIFMTKRERK
jgi:hypothetical protein